MTLKVRFDLDEPYRARYEAVRDKKGVRDGSHKAIYETGLETLENDSEDIAGSEIVG